MKYRVCFLPILLLMFTLGVAMISKGQEVLSADMFIQQVKQFHPVAKQGNLVPEMAAANLLTARGAFDPELEAGTTQKSLDGDLYYQYLNPQLKLPTAAPVTVKAGYEYSDGIYRNPEWTNGVMSYLGLEIPILKGLLTDKKRTALQQARIYTQQSEEERFLLLNDLLLQAYSAYWEWAGAYKMFHSYNNFLNVAQRRLQLVQVAFKNGDRSAADTIEALAQVQNFELLQAGAWLAFTKSTIGLSDYLWTEDGEPYLPPPVFIPDTLRLSAQTALPDTAALLADVRTTHPSIRVGEYKLKTLELERRLKFQDLLPTVNLQANLLSKEYFQYKDLSAAYLQNNYKWGVQVKLPVLWRESRGQYKGVKLKLRMADLELAGKRRVIDNKVRAVYTELVQVEKQTANAQAVLQSYLQLLKIEELRFNQGESSLFLVNARENKIIETQQKIIELSVKYQRATAELQWASGILR
jgi:outer membrane protein TolC